MIPMLRGWRLTAEGDREVIQARPGAILGYVERNRPLTSATEAARLALADLELETVSDPEEHVTLEGEYGAVLRAVGKTDGHLVQRSIGVVFGDDFYSLIDLTAFDEADFDARHEDVRALVHNEALGLGVRRRPFRHEGPAGWEHARRGLADSYERGTARIRIYPANPMREAVGIAADALFDDLRTAGFVASSTSTETLVTPAGLVGVAIHASGTLGGVRTQHAIVVLDDGRYLYVVREDAQAADFAHGALGDVLRSLEPLPLGRARIAEPTVGLRLLAHWAS